MLSKNMNKRGEGMTLNIVVVTVILLIVLAIIIFIFVKGTNNFQTGSSCDPNQCRTTAECSDGEIPTPWNCKLEDKTQGSYCCIKVGE